MLPWRDAFDENRECNRLHKMPFWNMFFQFANNFYVDNAIMNDVFFIWWLFLVKILKWILYDSLTLASFPGKTV